MKRRATLLLALCLLCAAPSEASWTLLGHGAYGSGANGGTSSGFNLGSPDLLVVFVPHDRTCTVSLSDSNSNTYTRKDPTSTIAGGKPLAMFYASTGTSGVTGGASVTFTLSGSSCFPSLVWMSFTGSKTSGDPFVTSSDAAQTNAASLSTGSITAPSGDLLVSGMYAALDASTGASINDSFTFQDGVDFLSSNHYGGADADKIATGLVDSPTWFPATQNDLQVMLAQFAQATAPPASTGNFFSLFGR